MSRSMNSKKTEQKLTPEQMRIEKEIALQQPKYQRMQLIANFKGKLRERKFYQEQLKNEITILDGNCDFKQPVPRFMVENSLDKIEISLEQLEDTLRVTLNMSDEEISEVKKDITG